MPGAGTDKTKRWSEQPAPWWCCRAALARTSRGRAWPWPFRLVAPALVKPLQLPNEKHV